MLFTNLFVVFFCVIIIFSAIVAQKQPDFSQFSQCRYEQGGENLPKFDVEHELGFELKVKTNTSERESIALYEGIGYYENKGSRGSTLFRRLNGGVSGQQYQQYIYDVDKNRGFLITSQKPRECQSTANFNESVCTPYVFFIGEEAGYEAISEKCGFIKQAIGFVKDYTGKIREIAANKWVQCVWLPPLHTSSLTEDDGSYWFFEFFHTKSLVANAVRNDDTMNYTMSTAQVAPLLLHVVRLDAVSVPRSGAYGGSRHYAEQTYEYFHYKPYIEHKQNVFEPPPGVMCRGWHEAQYGDDEYRALPVFKPHFTLSAVTVTSSLSPTTTDTKSGTNSKLVHSIISYDGKMHLRHVLVDMKPNTAVGGAASAADDGTTTDSSLHSIIDVYGSELTFVMRQDRCIQDRRTHET